MLSNEDPRKARPLTLSLDSGTSRHKNDMAPSAQALIRDPLGQNVGSMSTSESSGEFATDAGEEKTRYTTPVTVSASLHLTTPVTVTEDDDSVAMDTTPTVVMAGAAVAMAAPVSDGDNTSSAPAAVVEFPAVHNLASTMMEKYTSFKEAPKEIPQVVITPIDAVNAGRGAAEHTDDSLVHFVYPQKTLATQQALP